ncbi:hydrogenase maturation protease [Geomonas sp.]|uniref:hydrogenase maturation protease n=1 Tax=Geomonas sp. TaxID=2651584 RepID=UPI002B46E850|nr:hydrogenase maturation protease [Geomonas sp.]HJV37194.1 hydrogenase maturation protease [Geomonas sp.]
MSAPGFDGPGAGFLETMASCGAGEVKLAGGVLRAGTRVRLKPRPGGDVLDMALAGRVAVVEGIDEDDLGGIHVGVVIEDDPGRDLGELRHPAHRFFFAPDELELIPAEYERALRRVLVAGIGNVFLGDDGFGVEVVKRLLDHPLPDGIVVCDFGVRGLDLAYALVGGYDAAILVDLAPRGGSPGNLYLMELDQPSGEPISLDSHQMSPQIVLTMASQLGTLPPQLLLVGCEPTEDRIESMSMEMTPEVAAAVQPAAEMVRELAGRLRIQ